MGWSPRVKRSVRRPLAVRHRIVRLFHKAGGAARVLPQALTSGDMERIAVAVGGLQVRQIAVIVARRPAAAGRAFMRRYPGAQVHVLDVRPDGMRWPTRRRVTTHRTATLLAIHETLSTLPSVQILIENASEKAIKTGSLRHLLFHVVDGGVYVVCGIGTLRNRALQRGRGLNVSQALNRILEVKDDPELVEHRRLPTDELARADAIDSVTRDGHLIIVRKAGTHALKLRDREAEPVLLARHGPGWGRRIDTREPLTFHSRGRAHANRLEDSFRTEMQVPRMYLREFRDVVCAPRALVVQDNVILPVSFHHGMRRRLLQRSLVLRLADSHFAVLDDSMARAQWLPGVYYHLDSEFPGHFGHFMTEDIAKLWGWSTARAAHPELKILLSTDELDGEPATVQRAVLAAWGIPASDVVCIDQPARVDLLVGATQMFYNGTYVHPEMEQIWRRLREQLRSPHGQRAPTPKRIFVTRAPDGVRTCRNGAEVEGMFVEHGFEIARPEQLTIRQQVDLFAEAEFVAGFGGSGMFSSVYSTIPGRRIVIASDEYLARNEWTISALNGDEYHHFFGDAEIRRDNPIHPRWAFQSAFSFDFRRDGAALRALLRD
jgi:capsular polysaccharide biosynthesis protein